MCKKRVLFTGEASYLATGFGTYWKEVISRLYKTGEFEIAEQGSYAKDNDPQIQQIPWKFYPVQPAPNDHENQRIFNSSRTNQFGEWRFANACMDFKPDIVCSIRDDWMDEFVLRSPLRNKFKFIWMPTIDGIPQKQDWLDHYRLCDSVLTYSRWGMKVLQKDGRPGTNILSVASPGVDTNVFKPPQDKRKHKSTLGIDPDSIIIGTVMRNQKRKLYYDLIEAFSLWVHKNKTKGHLDLVRKTFLYLHTSYPDQGWDIGAAIKEFKVSNKVIMTYLCEKCGISFPAFFSGDICLCKKCNTLAAHPPNAQHHVSRETLAAIMNTFDLYVQYSICEGYGMPCVDAMACGVPVAAVRYSAMEDHLEAPGSIPIEVERFFREPMVETEQRRALPNNQDFANKLDKFLKLSERQRTEISQKIRDYVVEPVETYGSDKKFPRCSWDRTAEIWRNVLHQTDIQDPQTTWLNPKPQVYPINTAPPKPSMNNAEFVRWVITDIWRRPDMAYTTFAGQWIRGLNVGFIIEGLKKTPLNRQVVLDHFVRLAEERNRLELIRVGQNTRSQTSEISVATL